MVYTIEVPETETAISMLGANATRADDAHTDVSTIAEATGRRGR